MAENRKLSARSGAHFAVDKGFGGTYNRKGVTAQVISKLRQKNKDEARWVTMDAGGSNGTIAGRSTKRAEEPPLWPSSHHRND